MYVQLLYLGNKFIIKRKSLFSVYRSIAISSCLYSGRNILLPIVKKSEKLIRIVKNLKRMKLNAL